MHWLRLATALVIVVGVFDSSQVMAAQNLRELARVYARERPGVPIDQPAPPGDYWPKTIRELAKEADLALRARLSRVHSYLAPSEDRILTDYSIEAPRFITGHLPDTATRTPGTVVPMILTVLGGEVMLEGVVVRSSNYNRESIEEGVEYLLFLRTSRLPGVGRYEIYYAGIFEIVHDKVKQSAQRIR